MVRVAAVLFIVLATPVSAWAQVGDRTRAIGEVRDVVDDAVLDARREASEFSGGRRVGTVELTCGAETPCGTRRELERLHFVMNLEAGDPASPAAIAAAIDRLRQTTWFSSVEAVTTRRGDLVDVVFEATPAVFIRDMRVRAGLALGSEVRRRVFLRSGQPWTDDPALVTRQRDEIRAYFEQSGFFGGRVEIRVEPDERDRVVDLTFDVNRGTRRRVGNLYLRGHESLSYDEARVEMLGSFNLLRTYTTRDFAEARESLLERYRELGYIQARITLDETRTGDSPDLVDLFVEVREGDRWEVEFVGNRTFGRAELLDRLTFFRTGFVDAAEIEVAVRELGSMYETVGRAFAAIDVRQDIDDDGTRTVRFQIDEGPVAEIREIDIRGVPGLDTDALRAVMATSEYDLLAAGGYLQRSQLANDVRAVEAELRRQGWLFAEVTRVVLVGEDGGRDLYVTLHVDPGPSISVGRVDLAGADLPGRVRRALRLSEGGGFSSDALNADAATLRQHLRAEGHPFAVVEALCTDASTGAEVSCEPEGTPPACRRSIEDDRDTACARSWRGGRIVEECVLRVAEPACVGAVDAAPRGVDVEWSLRPGGRATFGTLLVRGNYDTRRRAIRQELPFRPGDPYDVQELLEGQSNLRSLGLFDSVRVHSIWHEPDDADENMASVVVQVEEGRTRFVEHRVAIESRVTPQSDLQFIFANAPSWRDLNFLGRVEELRVIGNFDIDLVDPSRLRDGEFRAGAGLVYVDPRYRMYGLLDEPWESQTALLYTYDLLAVAPSPLSREIEGTTVFRDESQRVRGLTLELGLSGRRTWTLDQSDAEVVNQNFTSALILSIVPRVTLDRRDNPLNPTRGTWSQVELEIADDLIAALDSEQFTKLTIRGAGFVPLGRGLVGGASVRFGLASGSLTQGFDAGRIYALPLAERYALGGVTTLRGFAEGEVSPVLTDQFGGDVVLNGALELRYPWLRGLGLDGAVFVDAGQIARDLDEVRPDGFRASAGFGVRWLIAGLIPLVIDYGAVLGRRPGERFGRLHFNIGYTF